MMRQVNLFRLLWLCMLTGIYWPIMAQQNRESDEKIIAELMERWIENNESTIDYTDLQEQLEFYIHNKLNLNKASREDFQRLPILDDETINAIIKHRNDFGEFMTVYELQTIESIDDRMVYYLSYFVKVDETMFGDQTSLLKMIVKGKHEIIVLHENDFQEREGYSASRKESGKEYYLGSSYRELVRYRFTYSNLLSFGYTGEKDMGEQFFTGAQKYGFDFNSFHFVLRNQSHFKTIAIGDYQANFGQGLTFGSGLAARKSAYVLNVRRNYQTIRPYRSANENEFLRGSAITYQYKSLEVTGLFSYNYISTNYRDADSLVEDGDIFSSVQLTGLHRTVTEVENRRNVAQCIYGGHAKWRGSNYDVGFTAINTFYDHSFKAGTKPYQYYNFSGKQLANIGFDYNFYLRNANFFGEVANSSNGAVSGIYGMMVPLHQRIDIVMLYRKYAQNHQPIFNNPFGENSDGRNEEGFYTGLTLKLNHRWVFNTYMDMYRSPWLRYLTDGPSRGYDYLCELQYNPSKSTQLYIRYRHEVKTKNLPNNTASVDYLSAVSRDIVRLHMQYKLSASVSAKTRLEYVEYHDDLSGYKTGTLIFQDIAYTSPTKKMSITTRVALFNVEDYNARVYATESDVLYQYAIPQYQNSGVRYYFVIHYRLLKHVDIWLKYSQTTYSTIDKISSGLEQINGNVLSDMRLQMRWSF